jgi:hypothetical protein
MATSSIERRKPDTSGDVAVEQRKQEPATEA